MKIFDFSGGLNSRLRPQYISTNEARVYDNIDNSVGTLLAAKDKSATDQETKKFAIRFKDTWVSDDTYASSVEFQQKLYRSDGLLPTSYDGTDTYRLGVLTPETAVTIVTDAGSPNVVGTVQYAYSYYSSTIGVESALSPLSVELLSLGRILISNMDVSSDSRIDTKRIYRTDGNLSTFTMVDEIPNEDTTYTDIILSSLVDGRLRPAIGDLPAPDDLLHIAEAYAMLFGAQGSTVRYTPIGRPESWPETHSLEFNADITGIRAIANGILVTTLKQTHIILGKSPTALSTQLLDGSQGCLGSQSMQQLGSGLLWISEDGLCTSSGGKVKVVSRHKLGKLKVTPVNSVVHDDVYYLSTDTYTLAFDLRFDEIFKTFTLGVESLAIGDDTLYGWADGLLYELFSAETNLSMSYESPRFPEGLLTSQKAYKMLHIYHTGDIILNILIDDKVVKTMPLDSTGQYQIPTLSQKGHFIQFNLSGTGEVWEISYDAPIGETRG